MAFFTRSLPLIYRTPGRNAYGRTRCLSIGRSSTIVTTTTTGRADVNRHNIIKSFSPHPYGSSILYQQTDLRLQKSSISTTAPRKIVGWIQDKLTERAKTKKAAKLIDQIALMANSPTWTIKMFADEIDETLSSWQTKIPGASRTSEIQTAKETQIVVKGILDHLGNDVTAEDIAKLDRKQKLRLSIACKKPMDEIDVLSSPVDVLTRRPPFQRILSSVHLTSSWLLLEVVELFLTTSSSDGPIGLYAVAF